MDAAASEFYNEDKKVYDLDFKNKNKDGSRVRELYLVYFPVC